MKYISLAVLIIGSLLLSYVGFFSRHNETKNAEYLNIISVQRSAGKNDVWMSQPVGSGSTRLQKVIVSKDQLQFSEPIMLPGIYYECTATSDNRFLSLKFDQKPRGSRLVLTDVGTNIDSTIASFPYGKQYPFKYCYFKSMNTALVLTDCSVPADDIFESRVILYALSERLTSSSVQEKELNIESLASMQNRKLSFDISETQGLLSVVAPDGNYAVIDVGRGGFVLNASGTLNPPTSSDNERNRQVIHAISDDSARICFATIKNVNKNSDVAQNVLVADIGVFDWASSERCDLVLDEEYPDSDWPKIDFGNGGTIALCLNQEVRFFRIDSSKNGEMLPRLMKSIRVSEFVINCIVLSESFAILVTSELIDDSYSYKWSIVGI